MISTLLCLSIAFPSLSFITAFLQVTRANMRFDGAKFLLQVLNQDTLLPSVQYATICGWLGVIGMSSTTIQSLTRPHYMCNVEHIPPSLQTQVELVFHEINQWVINRLRSSIWDTELALKQAASTIKKRDGTDE